MKRSHPEADRRLSARTTNTTAEVSTTSRACKPSLS
nr:MAG TPA: hypothetical protein [Caudoviricetes sp.]DAO94234.1 MAG TPA: hypothetical protein [Caudoviricetes sp.]DAU24726.1 MAG TPA: hypothetical protein [Caudoviricetes sp.]